MSDDLARLGRGALRAQLSSIRGVSYTTSSSKQQTASARSVSEQMSRHRDTIRRNQWESSCAQSYISDTSGVPAHMLSFAQQQQLRTQPHPAHQSANYVGPAAPSSWNSNCDRLPPSSLRPSQQRWEGQRHSLASLCCAVVARHLDCYLVDDVFTSVIHVLPMQSKELILDHVCDLRYDPLVPPEHRPEFTVDLLRVFIHSDISTLNLMGSGVTNRLMFECLSLDRLKGEQNATRETDCDEWEQLADAPSSLSGLFPYRSGSIRTLDLSYCRALEGGVTLVEQFVNAFPNLTRLSIAGCFSAVTGPETFSAIAFSMPGLKLLDASACFWMTADVLVAALVPVSPVVLEKRAWGSAACDLEGTTPTDLPLPHLKRIIIRDCPAGSDPSATSFLLQRRPGLTIVAE